uniref:Uncharacterized protein n=1 Tax=Lygus hesperus TaxID=30085 RepID=A0A0A9YEN1_LYGHE
MGDAMSMTNNNNINQRSVADDVSENDEDDGNSFTSVSSSSSSISSQRCTQAASSSRHDAAMLSETAMSFPAPATTPLHNYGVLQYISTFSSASEREGQTRHVFRPAALAFHAMCSYADHRDRCQRIVVYGGLSGQRGRVCISPELYEFSLLSGH